MKKNSFWNLLAFTVLLLALYVRVYRLPELLGFWYDQGRDALVIWDFLHNGKLFLIGPMMGNTGIFRGPWYYYLLAPFYYVSGGNPLLPNYFLIFLSVIGLLILYIVAKTFKDKYVALVSLLIASFSGYVIGASRWLSNPTPTLLVGVLFIYFCFKLLDKKWWALPATAFTIGMGLNFGAATEIFLIPALIVILYLNKKVIPSIKIIILSVFIFISTFLPQIIFEIRHGGVMLKAFYNFVFNNETFTINFVETLFARFFRYYDLFASKIWQDGNLLFLPFFLIFVYQLIKKFKTWWKDDKFKIVFITFISPFVGTLFFVSNLGGFYDYYFTAFYFVMIMFFSFVFLDFVREYKKYLLLLLFFIIYFYQNNISFNYYRKPLNDPEIIAFENQVKAINWIYADAKGTDFNLDVYVPPVVPYAYEYLLKWIGSKKEYDNNINNKMLPLLYTLYEADNDHPDRIGSWLERQKTIGNVLYEEKFGGITVQRRERIQ